MFFLKKYAKWCGHMYFLGIFLALECPELYENVYMSLGQIDLIFIFICRTLCSVFFTRGRLFFDPFRSYIPSNLVGKCHNCCPFLMKLGENIHQRC